MGTRVGSRQIQCARDVNFINFLQDKLPHLIEYSMQYRAYIHPEHDSLKYFEGGYFQFSKGEGGDSIKFLEEFCEMTFQDAVLYLYEYSHGYTDKALTRARHNKDYKPPKAYDGAYTRLFAYLTNTRMIDSEIIQDLVNRKLLYEDVNHNIVFINREKDKGIAISRGTIKMGNGRVFKRIDIENSNNYWVFEAGENPENVYVCESPIDAISLYELRMKSPGIYCAMAGLKPETLKRILSDYKDKYVLTAADWDQKGIAFMVKMRRELDVRFTGTDNKEERKITKDWNDLLCLRKKK